MTRGLEPIAELAAEGLIGAEDAARQFGEEIYQACDRKLKKVRTCKKTVPWWNQGLSDLRVQVRRTRSAYQNCCQCRLRLVKLGIYKTMKRRYVNEVKRSKKESWGRFVAEVTNEDPFSILYKIGAEKIKNHKVLTTLRSGNEDTRTNEETMTHLL